MLAVISQLPKNDLFVEQLLQRLSNVARIAVENQDRSMYSSSIYWYIDIVFNKPKRKEGEFDLSYLELFDKYFFSSVRYIVSGSQTSLFKALVSSLHGFHILSYYEGKVWDYGHLILRSDFEKYKELDKDYNVEKRIKELVDFERELYTKEKLNEYLKKFGELKEILEPHFDNEQRNKAGKIEEEIKEFAISQFKYNNLLEIVDAMGAYCLFKDKPEYVRYLWEYKQPPDSDTQWVGHDIVPNTIDDVVNLYFRKDTYERKFDFWEDHHGSETYYKRYFLLLLAHVLQGVRPNPEGKYEQIENYTLPRLNIYRLSNLEYSIDELIEPAKELKGQIKTLGSLGFDTTKSDELFDKKLIAFLSLLKCKAGEQIKFLERNTQVSRNKIEEFKAKVLEGFNESVVLRNIFKHHKLYEDKTNEEYKGTLERFGLNRVDDKAAFFEEWHVHYGDEGVYYGQGLASAEDSWIEEKIASCCMTIEGNDFENTLEKFGNLSDIVIVATRGALDRFFNNSKGFKSKWEKNSPQLDVKGFEGWYLLKEQYISVFESCHRGTDIHLLILNKSRLGTLIQHSPLKEGEGLELKKDIFYMDIQAFSENAELMEKLITKPPEWLSKIGEESRQREHLRKSVLIHIFEQLEYSKHEEFEGYLLKLAD